MVDRVEQAGVGLDQAAADHFHGARDADTAFVVAVHVGTHGQLGLFLLRVEQFLDVFRVLERVAGAARGAGDGAGFDAGAFHADEHFGGSANQLLAAAHLVMPRHPRRIAGHVPHDGHRRPIDGRQQPWPPKHPLQRHHAARMHASAR